tara:strand:+ start:379 stop:1371 length:993 start_codon:yes stop_codon:yes gene_type:complete
MAKDILKEAIADAKAVREVALANAKAALEEAFTPKLQNMLSAKLSEELDENMYDEDEKEMDEMMYDEDEKNLELGEMGNMYDEDESENSMDEEIDLEEILNELELEEEDKADDKEELEEMGRPVYTADSVQTNHQYKADYVHENDEHFDLDSLLKEINDLDEEEILEIEDDEKEDVTENKGCGCNEEKTSIKNLNYQLKESTKAYTTVRKELNEVNLLNSKLLYVNRIFKANNLSETDKLRVVETLDKATSVKEAKLIYETVKNTFIISSPKKNKTFSKKSIKENFKGMASKAAGVSRTKATAPKRAILKESNDMVARMQKLANIGKIKE